MTTEPNQSSGEALKGSLPDSCLSFKIFYDIKRIKDEWEALGKQLEHYCFYHKPAWISAYARAFKPQQLIFIGIYYCVSDIPSDRSSNSAYKVEKDILCGIIPFEYFQYKKYFTHLKVLRLPYHDHLDLADCILAEKLPASLSHQNLLPALLKFINHRPELAWDVLLFAKTPANSHSHRLFSRHQIKHCYSVKHGDSSFIQCQPSYEQSVAHISSKFKRNLARLERKAEKQGQLTYQSLQCSQEPDRDLLKRQFQTFLNVESDSWKSATQTAIIFDPAAVNFYRFLTENFVAPDSCVINSLKLDDEVIATQFGIMTGSRLNLLKIGFRESHKDIGPGNIIFNRTLKTAVDRRLSQVSTTTAPAWAEKWKSDSIPLYRHIIFNQTSYGQMARLFFLMLPTFKSIKKGFSDFFTTYFKDASKRSR